MKSCQDLSLAGKGKGMSDTSTRSGMLWEVERILTELKETNSLPQCLIMENVPQVHGEGNVEDFNKWQLRLEELGYKNYWEDLIATDYGIPQTRNRCFMVSILGDYSYTFPKPIPLEKKLKDMLEDNVDEKYYLSDKMKQYIFSENDKYKVNKNNMKIDREIACSKTTREGWTRADTSDYITQEFGNKSLQETLKQNNIDDTCYIDTYNKRIDKEKSGTITTGVSFRNNTFLAIKNATKKGYLEATNGDGVDISSRMEYHRGTVQKGKSQTLTTQCDRGVVINNINSKAKHQQDIIQDSNGNARTLVCGTHGNGGHYTKTLMNDLRIRKLTPKECFRLMGVKDEDFEKVKVNQSDSSLYHLAGDSIVVNVLMAIFKEII